MKLGYIIKWRYRKRKLTKEKKECKRYENKKDSLYFSIYKTKELNIY